MRRFGPLAAGSRLIFALALLASLAPSAGADPIKFLTAPVYGSNANERAAIDYDQDGDLDIAEVSTTVSIRINLGATFATFTPVVFGESVTDIAAGDLNGDGRTDLIACGFA